MLERLKIKLNNLRISFNSKPAMFISVFLFSVAKGASDDKIPEFEGSDPETIAEWEFLILVGSTIGAVVAHLLGIIFL